MDRDFVLNIKAPQAQRSFLLTGRDGNGIAALGELSAVLSWIAPGPFTDGGSGH